MLSRETLPLSRQRSQSSKQVLNRRQVFAVLLAPTKRSYVGSAREQKFCPSRRREFVCGVLFWDETASWIRWLPFRRPRPHDRELARSIQLPRSASLRMSSARGSRSSRAHWRVVLIITAASRSQPFGRERTDRVLAPSGIARRSSDLVMRASLLGARADG